MLEVKWKVHFVVLVEWHLWVSILVMLEVKWKVESSASIVFIPMCFNPCYVGSKMESRDLDLSALLVGTFQSLLCWK